MIKVTGLAKAFGALRAVDDLSFEAAPNRITSIIGPNGAGKSTAFNLIAGTLAARRRLGRAGRPRHHRAAAYRLAQLGVARSFQITNLFFGLSVLENIRLACQSLEPRSRYLVRLDRLAQPRSARAASCSRSSASPTRRMSWSAICRTAISAGSRSRSAWRCAPSC